MIRKFALLSLPAVLRLIAPDLGIESALGMLIMLLSGMGYSSINPFRNQRDQLLMLPTQIVQAIALLCGMAMSLFDHHALSGTGLPTTMVGMYETACKVMLERLER